MVRRKVARSSTIQEPFSVQYRGPSPDSKSGLIMGNLLGSEVSLNHSCVPRCSVQYPPSLFGKRISRPALITGESRDSGRIQGLDQMGKDGKSRPIPERIVGESRGMFQIRDLG